MNTVFIGPGGIPRVVTSQSPGVGLQSQRVASSVGTGVARAVQFASAPSMQSSPSISDRVEDVTEEDDEQVAQQAAAFAARFMGPAKSTPAEIAAPAGNAAGQARLMPPPMAISAAHEGRLAQLQHSMEAQGQRLQADIQEVKDSVAGLVSTSDFNTWSVSMNGQVAEFLQDGLAEVARDVQLQLQVIRDECKLMIETALSAPKGAGKAPEGDPEVEPQAGSKRKQPEVAKALLLPDLGAAMASTANAATPAPPSMLGSEADGLVTTADGQRLPAYASVRMCVEAVENTMTKVVNQNFSVAKWSPPSADILDSEGVLLFPAAARFDILPIDISKLNVEELKLRLEAFGFAKAMLGKMARPKAKQLLQWKVAEATFVAHHLEHPAPAAYGRATEIRPAWRPATAVSPAAPTLVTAGLAHSRGRRVVAGEHSPPACRCDANSARDFTPGLRAALLVG